MKSINKTNKKNSNDEHNLLLSSFRDHQIVRKKKMSIKLPKMKGTITPSDINESLKLLSGLLKIY
jgi:hypothetical protein